MLPIDLAVFISCITSFKFPKEITNRWEHLVETKIGLVKFDPRPSSVGSVAPLYIVRTLLYLIIISNCVTLKGGVILILFLIGRIELLLFYFLYIFHSLKYLWECSLRNLYVFALVCIQPLFLNLLFIEYYFESLMTF